MLLQNPAAAPGHDSRAPQLTQARKSRSWHSRASARSREAALEGLDRWKARHPDAACHLEAKDVLVDAMRGHFTTWTRTRIDLGARAGRDPPGAGSARSRRHAKRLGVGIHYTAAAPQSVRVWRTTGVSCAGSVGVGAKARPWERVSGCTGGSAHTRAHRPPSAHCSRCPRRPPSPLTLRRQQLVVAGRGAALVQHPRLAPPCRAHRTVAARSGRPPGIPVVEKLATLILGPTELSVRLLPMLAAVAGVSCSDASPNG
jgi:hypothetical protein